MATTVRAHFDGQHFIPDEPVIGLAPGTPVAVVPMPETPVDRAPSDAGNSALRWLAENPIEDENLPADLGLNHDHYLYGTPKKSD